jgi:hypothetical protein
LWPSASSVAETNRIDRLRKKNTNSAAIPMSAIASRLFLSRRLSGRPAQVSRVDIRPSTSPSEIESASPQFRMTQNVLIQSVAAGLSLISVKMRIAGR